MNPIKSLQNVLGAPRSAGRLWGPRPGQPAGAQQALRDARPQRTALLHNAAQEPGRRAQVACRPLPVQGEQILKVKKKV